MMAAWKGNVGIVRKLIKHGASVNLTNKVNQVLFQSLGLAHSNRSTNCLSTGLTSFHALTAEVFVFFSIVY